MTQLLKRRWFKLAIALGIAVAVVGVCNLASACPTCKDSVAQNDPHYQSMAKGYYYSILFMMSTPYIVLATFGSCAYYSIRRARQRQTAAEDASAMSS